MQKVDTKAEGTSKSPSRVIVKTQGFQGLQPPDIIVEQPPSLREEDRGASPVSHMLAGLIGSINWIGHLVATEMDFEIKKLDVTAEGTFDADHMFGEIDPFTDARAGLKSVKVFIHIEADVDESRLELWRKAIRFRCPIIDNLTNPTPVKVRLTNGEQK